MNGKLNFSQVTALVVDSDNYATGILTQILRGFDLTRYSIARNGKEAKELLKTCPHDLMICEYVLPDMSGTDLVRWLRQTAEPQLKFLPVVLLTGYTQFSNVAAARDCGANIVVKKPIAPSVLFDHVAWAAEGERPYIETNSYIGPCRRFKFSGPPDGAGRRASDVPADAAEAVEPNMPPEQINSVATPARAPIE